MNTLKTVKIGQTVKVVKLHGEGAVKRRIMDKFFNPIPLILHPILHFCKFRD